MMKQNKNTLTFEKHIPVLGPFCTADITRGVCRYLQNLGYSPLTEFKLLSKRRVDVIGLDKLGRFIIVEIKSSVSDFRADKKWSEYIAYGDQFYFGVANGFPVEILPEECGIIIADAYNAAILKKAPVQTLNSTRRRVQQIRYAKTAADRLQRVHDPNIR